MKAFRRQIVPSQLPAFRPPPVVTGKRSVHTAHGVIAPAVATQVTIAQLDAVNETFKLIRVDGNGNQVSNTGGVILARTACLGTDGTYHTLNIVEVQVCIDNGDGTFTKKKALTVISDFY